MEPLIRRERPKEAAHSSAASSLASTGGIPRSGFFNEVPQHKDVPRRRRIEVSRFMRITLKLRLKDKDTLQTETPSHTLVGDISSALVSQ